MNFKQYLDISPEVKEALDSGKAVVVIQEGQAHGVDDGPHRENQQQYNRRSEVQPGFPLMLAVYHITSPRR